MKLHQITGLSVKPSISEVILSEDAPWVSGIPSFISCPTYVRQTCRY